MSLKNPIQRMLKRAEGFTKTESRPDGSTIVIGGTSYPIVDYVQTLTRENAALLGEKFVKSVPVRWPDSTANPNKGSTVTLDGAQYRIDSVDDRKKVAGYIVLNLVDR